MEILISDQAGPAIVPLSRKQAIFFCSERLYKEITEEEGFALVGAEPEGPDDRHEDDSACGLSRYTTPVD